MKSGIRFVLIASIFLGIAYADEPSLGPVIEGYGPTYPISDRDVALSDGFVYKAVFDAADNADETALNTGLVSVARYLNMHGRNGVALEEMKIAVVAHGPALKMLLTNDAYRVRYGIDNPNSELLGKLTSAGVELYVCGQSMAFGGFSKSELASDIDVGLSAMTMLTVLQSDGYALLK